MAELHSAPMTADMEPQHVTSPSPMPVTSPRRTTLLRLGLAVLLAAAPLAAGAQSLGSNDIYDVAVNATGEYTARTGAGHPTPGLDVFYLGILLTPATTWNSVRSYDSSREWVLRTTPSGATPGFACDDINARGTGVQTPLVDGGGRPTGVRTAWQISDSLDDLEVVQEVNAEGTTYVDSVVRVTLCITNNGIANASVGMRYQWDWQIAANDGPFIGIRPPYPPNEPFLANEQDFLNPTFDFYDVSNTQNPTINPSIYRVGGTVNAPAQSMGPTPPELVQYASWPGAVARCFTYRTTGAVIAPDPPGDSCVTYYWGATPATSILLAPGETWCASQYVFVFDDVPPPRCMVSASAAGGATCDDTMITIDATGSWATDCAGVIEWRFTDGAGRLVQDWSTNPYHVATTTGTYQIEARCSTDTACFDVTYADVIIEQRPILRGGSAIDLASCNLGLEVTWDEAVWPDPAWGGVYDVYRSEMSCADALLQPILRSGVLGTSINDDGTLQGRSYYYVIVAESATLAMSCRPIGPRGGAITTYCIGPVDDVADPTPPMHFCWPLRVHHAGDAVTLDWSLGRSLQPGEHLHVLKRSGDAAGAFSLVNAEGETGTTWSETDLTARVQFYDVRVANQCEVSSADDEPPGLDPPAGVPCP